MKFKWIFSLAAVLSFGLMAGCSPKMTEKDIHFNLEQHAFELQSWSNDDSHVKQIKGTLTLGNRGIENADVLYDGKKVLHTDKDGSFSLMVDKSFFSHKLLSIQSVDHALVRGKSLDKNLQEAVKKQVIDLDIFYPITVLKTEDRGDKVVIEAQLSRPGDNKYPTMELEKYMAKGVVKDANGKPVSGAIVSIIEDGLEGFSKAEPTNEKGEFSLKYMSEDANRLLRVSANNQVYNLPPDTRVMISEGTSSQFEITLPKVGTTLKELPPDLVIKPLDGAVYSGIMPGINAPKNSYLVTVPSLDGLFTLTVDKKVWETNPLFFETYVSGFTQHPVEIGKPLPDDLVVSPLTSEPQHIQIKKAP